MTVRSAVTTLPMLSVPVGAYTLEVPADMAWCFEGGSYYERNVATWFERIVAGLDGGAVYDVGANCGYYSLLAARAGAPVYAFEPVETTFETLRRNLEQVPGATAFPVGVAGAPGRHSIQLYSSSGNNSLFARTLPPGHSLVHTGSQEIQLVALDGFAEERGLEAPALIKLDIEGAELSAIRGARELIARHRPYLIVEYSEATARDAGYDRADLVAELRALGYELYALSSDESDESAYPLEAASLPDVDNLIAVPAGQSLPAAAPGKPTVDLLIYSKDRPAQLEVLLRSSEQLLDERDAIDITVVFTHSAPEFARGYEIVRELHSRVRFVDEHDTGETFKETTLRLLGGADYTVFLVDDDVFKQPFSLGSQEFRTFAQDPEIACLSLRMCPRMNYCYALDKVTAVPAFDGTTWRWPEAEGDWGYPMSLDGHVFRTREVMPLLEALPFHHPNSLESALAEHPLAAPKAVCFAESRIVNIPANRVQDTHQNRHMGLATPEELNERFLAGERIALEPIERVRNVGPHHEMELEWEPGEHAAEAAQTVPPARTVVFADELIERPDLALAYADTVEPGRDSELVIYAPDADPGEAGARVSALLAEHSLDDRGLDMVLLAVPTAEGDLAVAGSAHALLTKRPAPPAFAALPTVGAPARPPATPEGFYGQFVSSGDLVFDVGANMGNRTETFLALGANVVAVEPQAEATSHLRSRWPGEPRLTILECGLGDREGEAELFVSNAHTLTSMAPDWIEAIQTSGRFAEYRWDERRVVPITTLATLIDLYGEPAFCKIDVEGFEEKVLAGLDRPLRACSLEFASEALSHLRRCVERLAELGPVECNYSLGESMELAEPAWVSPGDLLARLESLPGDLPWGDVYVRARDERPTAAPAPSAVPLCRERVVDHIGRQKVEGDYRNWGWYLDDLEAYQAMPGAPRIELADLNPQLHDKTPTNPYDGHYFFQDVWAARRVADARPKRHVDVGSRVDYVGFLTALTDVTFVDIRPLEANIEGLTCIAGSILDMPFENQSLESLSCLHVAEHIGLGRYGDPLDPLGSRRAAAELQRVVAPGGQLLFAGPVGRPRVCFNAHRVHSPHDIVAMFSELQLVEFSGVDDTGAFRRHRTLDELEGADYGCGMFRFVRR